MKIEAGKIAISGFISSSGKSILEKGDIVRGRVLNIHGNKAELLLQGGLKISATLKGGTEGLLQVGKWFNFKVVECLPDRIEMKMVRDGDQQADAGVQMILSRLNVANTPESRAALIFILMNGLPLTAEYLEFFLGRRYRLSKIITELLAKARNAGLVESAEELESILPRPGNIRDFLEDARTYIKAIYERALKLCEELSRHEKETAFYDKLERQFLNIVLFQMNARGPFYFIQIPLKIKDDYYHSCILIDKKEDRLYFDVELPRMGRVGCLLEGWKRRMNVVLYCRPEFLRYLERESASLKNVLEKVICAVKSIEVLPHPEEGLYVFLSRYEFNYLGLDLKI